MVMCMHSRWNHSLSHCRAEEVSGRRSWVHDSGGWGRTYVVIAGYHFAVADIVADAISRFVRVDVVGLLCFLFRLLFLLVLAALGAFDVCYALLTILCGGDFALGWRFPTGACAGYGFCDYGLAEDAMAASLAESPTAFVWLGLFALCFGCVHVTASRARTCGKRDCLRHSLGSWGG